MKSVTNLLSEAEHIVAVSVRVPGFTHVIVYYAYRHAGSIVNTSSSYSQEATLTATACQSACARIATLFSQQS